MTERIPNGTVVEIVGTLPKFPGYAFDCRPGGLYIIEDFVPKADDNDPPTDVYWMEAAPGQGAWGSDYCAPVDNVRVVRTAREQQALMKMPSPQEIVALLQNGLMSANEGDIEVDETIRLREANSGSFEQNNPFEHGVEAYARVPGGVSFGFTVRITGVWQTDD